MWNFLVFLVEIFAEQQNFERAAKKLTDMKTKPAVTPAPAIEDDGTKKKREKKQKHETGGATNTPGRSKGLCLDFQTKYGAGGCKKKVCRYTHEFCSGQKEYDELWAKVKAKSDSSGSDSASKKNKNSPASAKKKPSKPELRKFRDEHCYFGASCRNKDTTCKRDHTKYPDKESWKAQAKKHGYEPKGSDSDSE